MKIENLEKKILTSEIYSIHSLEIRSTSQDVLFKNCVESQESCIILEFRDKISFYIKTGEVIFIMDIFKIL